MYEGIMIGAILLLVLPAILIMVLSLAIPNFGLTEEEIKEKEEREKQDELERQERQKREERQHTYKVTVISKWTTKNSYYHHSFYNCTCYLHNVNKYVDLLCDVDTYYKINKKETYYMLIYGSHIKKVV